MRLMSTVTRRLAVATVVIGALLASMGLLAPNAGAVALPAPPPGSPPTRAGATTEFTMSGTQQGQGVAGLIAPAGNPFDPLTGYPATDPVGWDDLNEGFAGIILGNPAGGGDPLQLYCIDIHTNTWGGLGYKLGTWDASTVANVGYVARILNEYFPNVPTEPPGLSNDNERAAATQAAIWFFSDRYVLKVGDPLRPIVAAITAKIIAEGPLVAPPPPSLTITPSTATGAIGSTAGPFTVNADAGTTPTVVSVGGDMFSDAAATQPIAQGATVMPGAQIFLRRTTVGTVSVAATAVAAVPTGNVYLYDNETPGTLDAQRLILAATGTVRTTATASAQLVDTASISVTKTIDGAGAGQQGEIRIAVTCGGVALPDFVIPAGATGPQTQTFAGIPTPASCTITETVNGANGAVTVDTTNGTQTVDLPANEVPDDPVATVPITDTFSVVAVTTTTTVPGAPTTEPPSVAPTDAATLPTTGGGSTGNLLALSVGVALTGAALVLATRRRARHGGAV